MIFANGHIRDVQEPEKDRGRAPSFLKMNANEFSRLSYKELQALAIRYRVPGNIKKKLLVKVLQAAKGGNDNEVSRLLQDLRQNRKKRVRKLKAGKLGITSTPLHSPNYAMADDYYCPQQQQQAYQWVAAEEEIVSRNEEGRIPHYEEFKQFLLRRIQRKFETYDVNNNQIQDNGIVDLRTAISSSSVQTIPIETIDYSRSNVIAVNNGESFLYPPNQRVEYHTVEDISNAHGSILLKKMLQAPVGANLGEIASPVTGSYRLWPMDQYQSTNLLDNSDTLTAESDTQDNEENFDNNAESYGLFSGIRGEYFLQDPTFLRNVEIGQQISNVLNNEHAHEYKYSNNNLETQSCYDNWAVNHPVDVAETNCATDAQSSKLFQTMYYDNSGPEPLTEQIHGEDLSCQYRIIENINSYNSSNLLTLNPTEETQCYDPNIVTTIQSDSANNYYLQNLTKYNTEPPQEYFNNMHPIQNVNTEHDVYGSTPSQTSSQTPSSSNNYNSGVSYEYPYSNQTNNVPTSENLEQQPPENRDNIGRQENIACKELTQGKTQTVQGVLDPFWPRNLSKSSVDTVLENILNFSNSKRVDLARLEQTSSVYCYAAPIVTHAAVPSSSNCSQKEKFVAEYRQHSFTPYWMLYDDSSDGMRMGNSQMNRIGDTVNDEVQIIQTVTSNNNYEEKSGANEAGDLKCNYEMEIEKNDTVCTFENVDPVDCLFPVMSENSLGNPLDPLSLCET